MTDCFEFLGLPVTSTRAEVRSRFKELVFSMHPDYGGDEVVFQNLKAAYDQAMAIVPEHTRCLACNGKGVLATQHGFYPIITTCPSCKGAGELR